jgi:hypothetical protein
MYDDPVSRALAVIRQHYDDGGDVEPLMSRIIEGVGDRAIRDKRVLEPEAVLTPGPEQSVWEKISSKFMGDRPSPERRRFVEGMGNIADVGHMGAYATPLAPYVGAADFARGVASGDPMEAALGATGLPGKGAKAVGMAASAMMPEDATAGSLSKALNAIRAYHGSPHKFDKFDISKIGTGEGAQAYGHGLYFAEHEPVAWGYKHSTSGRQATHAFDDMPIEGNQDYFKIEDRLNDEGNWRQAKALREYMNSIEPDIGLRFNQMKEWHRSDPKMVKAIDDLSGRIKTEVSPGHMYEVDIHANPEHILDWDKPLTAQSRHVIDRFNDAVSPVRDADDAMIRELFGDKTAHTSLNLFDRSKGSQAYRTFADERGGASAVSERLREAGIPGIKYLDQGSRGAGEGTSNYVVFDPSLIEILRRYKDGGSVGPQE